MRGSLFDDPCILCCVNSRKRPCSHGVQTSTSRPHGPPRCRFSPTVRYGLTSGVLTSGAHRGPDIARRLEAGMAHVNDQPVNDEPNMPFGGVKESGRGRFGTGFAAEEFSELRWITLRGEPRDFAF
ncbi:aldehyde dehydrogenase family protein [Streptomyces sp. NPDC002643]